jgi:hypothetical protein
MGTSNKCAKEKIADFSRKGAKGAKFRMVGTIYMDGQDRQDDGFSAKGAKMEQ